MDPAELYLLSTLVSKARRGLAACEQGQRQHVTLISVVPSVL